MNNQLQRKLKTRFIILKDKYIKPKFFIKIAVMLFLIFLITPVFLYIIIYRGYSEKIINNPDLIRDELTTGVLISDKNPQSFKSLTDIAVKAFQKRKINFLYVYLTEESKTISDENILQLLEKTPSSSIKVLRDAETPLEICDSAKNILNLDKFVVLSFKDIAIRTSFICNNENIYTQSIIPVVEDSALEITKSTLMDYIRDIIKVFTGISLS